MRPVITESIDSMWLPRRLAEPLGMSGDALDRAFTAFADQRVEGAELVLDAARLIVEVGHQGAAPCAQRILEIADSRSQRVIHAVAAYGNRGHRLACRGRELIADLAGVVRPTLERGAGDRFQTLLRGDRLGGDCVGGAARRLFDLGADHAGGIVDQGAKLRMASVEMFGPRGAGRIRTTRAHLRSWRRASSSNCWLADSSDSCNAWPRTTTNSCSRSTAMSSRDARPSPLPTTTSEMPRALEFDALDQFVHALAELARQRLAGDRQAGRHRVAVQTDRLGGLGAAVGDATDDQVVVGVERVAGRRSRRGELADDAVGMAAQGFDRLRARRLDAADQVLVAAGEITRQRLAGVANALVDVGDPSDDFLGGVAARRGQPGRDVVGDGADALDRRSAGAIHRVRDFLG